MNNDKKHGKGKELETMFERQNSDPGTVVFDPRMLEQYFQLN